MVYRAWAAIRFQELQPWAEAIYPDELTAYRHGVDLQKVNLERSLFLEGALIRGDSVFCLSFDLKKAFDHIPHGALVLLLRRLNCPPVMINMLTHRLENQQQMWKMYGTVSAPRRMARGLIQGCALSCLYFNMMMVPLLRAVKAAPLERETLDAHADDLFLFGTSLEKADDGQVFGAVLLTHGIVPLGQEIDQDQILRVQVFQLAASLTRLQRDKGEDAVRLEIPDFRLWDLVRGLRQARRLGREQPLVLQPYEHDEEWAQTQEVNQHVLRRIGGDAIICDACGLSYTLGNAYRYAYCVCEPGAPKRPTSALPARDERIDMSWTIPRHDGLAHVFRVHPNTRDISCDTCNARWKWR